MNRFRHIWYEVQIGWKAYLVVGLTIAGIILLYLRLDAAQRAAGTPTEALIVSFSTSPNSQKWRPDTVMVTARSKEGLFGRRTIPRALIAGCKVGDSVPAVLVGDRLRLEPWPCQDVRTGAKS